jgi:peptidoglycan/LPS O-acetylase OafA/YrhL
LEKNLAILAADAAELRGEMEVNEMTEKTQSNKVLDAIAWGVFIVLLGAGWITSTYYQIDTGIYIALGVGLILIALNLSRRTIGIKISKFSLFIGLLALALAGSGIAGFDMPFIPTVIVLVGLFIVAEAIQKTFANKPVQA